MGIPARVVQMVPTRAKGHTLVEVWDDARGWTVVDPSTGGSVTGAAQGAAVDLLADPAVIEWRPFGSAPVSAAESEGYEHQFQNFLTGNLLYPEPWLYLRLGKRVASWPFRGHYARVGPTFLTLGPAQKALTWAIPVLALAGLALLTCGWRLRHATADVVRTTHVHIDVEPLRGLDVLPRA